MVEEGHGKFKSVLITDCGSTITKAVLIEMVDGHYRLVAQAEAPTTVEAPHFDVTLGVRHAIHSLEQQLDRQLLRFGDDFSIITPPQRDTGVDLVLSTSSTGGGLQMLCAGLVKIMTAESAKRAALGAGAVVMDVIAIDDGRLAHEKVQRIRDLRPDAILLTGGIDGGNLDQVIEVAEQIAAAKLPPLPIIYAGNTMARPVVSEILGRQNGLRMVANVRPILEVENLEEPRQAIHDVFMDHVVAKAPGFDRLAQQTSAPILPSTGAMSTLVEGFAKETGINVLAAHIGDSTTDIFSVFQGRFTRTVAGDLGLGYSISNVLKQAELSRVTRWLPYPIDSGELRNHLRNKMLRPATIPLTVDDLMLEHAVAREALRLAVDQHRASAFGLRGVQIHRDIGDALNQSRPEETLVDMMKLDMIIGLGGVLAQARPAQAVMIMIDALQPEGITTLAIDGSYIAPHLGALAAISRTAALDVLQRDGLTVLATVIAPLGHAKQGDPCLTIVANAADGREVRRTVRYGQLDVIPIHHGLIQIHIEPDKGFDVGRGPGQAVDQTAQGGQCGVIIDARGRQPLPMPHDDDRRYQCLRQWYRVLESYPGLQ